MLAILAVLTGITALASRTSRHFTVTALRGDQWRALLCMVITIAEVRTGRDKKNGTEGKDFQFHKQMVYRQQDKTIGFTR